jgi:hypothetical protein
MALEPVQPLLSVLITPIDPHPANRRSIAITEQYGSLFRTGSDGDGTASTSSSQDLSSLQYKGQSAFDSISGPLQYIRFVNDGTVQFGTQAAVDSHPSVELCGLTARLRSVSLQNRMKGEDMERAPTSPENEPVLWWRSEQGNRWKTIVPARSPVVAAVRHDGAANQTVKTRTDLVWDENCGFETSLDLGGIPQEHAGEGRLRFSWGDKYSLFMHGQGADVYPTLERRQNGQWEQILVLNRGGAIGAQFWKSRHMLKLKRCCGRMLIDLDGQSYWVRETTLVGGESVPKRVTWPAAPLRLSAVGVDCALQVNLLTGNDPTRNVFGIPLPIEVNFSRSVPMPDTAPIDSPQTFAIDGEKLLKKGSNRALLRGDYLDCVRITGAWQGSTLNYDAKLTCTPTEAPLLSTLGLSFPPLNTTPVPEPLEFVKAISSLNVEAGDPNLAANSEASFTLSRSQLDSLVPNWQSALLPFRPVSIRTKMPGDSEWTQIFRGYLLPESVERQQWGDYEIPVIAHGPLMRILKPAALVDERFGPLDLLLDDDREQLYGCEAVRYLLETELGKSWTANFNGNGDTFRYAGAKPRALMSSVGADFFSGTQAPQSGGWRLPAPFGQFLSTWIDELAKIDYAVLHYDAQEDSFNYGKIVEFLRAREAKVWTVPEDASFPLISSLTLSGLQDEVPNENRVWGETNDETKGLSPSFIMGRYGDSDVNSTNPYSVAQSWRRTLLIQNPAFKTGIIDNAYANSLAYWSYRDRGLRPAQNLDLQFNTGFLEPRWGELLTLPTGFVGPRYGGTESTWRIVGVKHSFSLSGDGTDRFKTTINTRALSAQGQ